MRLLSLRGDTTTVRGRAQGLSGGARQRSGFPSCGIVFDRHVFEFTGLEDFAALFALDEFGVFFTGHDLHARVLTLIHFASLGWGVETTGLKS
jgi:hypothetical protein